MDKATWNVPEWATLSDEQRGYLQRAERAEAEITTLRAQLAECRAVLADISTRLHGDEYDHIVTWQTERRMDTLLDKLDMKQEKT
jgi:uncharacterized protein involved in exopolysaccharide biosynthesis